MTDHELEQLLRNHYRSLDPSTAPRGLALRIEDGMARRASRWAFLGRMPAIATGIATVAVVVLVIAFRPGGLLAPAGATPSIGTPRPSISATPETSSSAPSAPTPSPSISLPGGSIPPASTQLWLSLDLVAASGNPPPGSVVAWSGGYLALGSVVGAQNGTPAQAWVSGDGRTWTPLPDGTFGNVISLVAAPTSDGVVVLATAPDGTGAAWRSTDGLTWTPGLAPTQRRIDNGYVAGGAGGVVVAVEVSQPARVERSADGSSWHTVSMPGPTDAQVNAVTAFGAGFVAVGHDFSGAGSPSAWWSPDGVTWNLAQVPAHPGELFTEVHAAAGGLVAMSRTNTVPDVVSFWTSRDGRSWQISTDPLGKWQQGAGAGNPNGLFSGDGTRLLAYGITADGQPTEYWTSIDATTWTKLTLTGDTAAAVAGNVTPMLLRDGILFVRGDRAWFGSPPN